MGPESGLSNSILVCKEINRAQKDYQLKREGFFTLSVVPFSLQNSRVQNSQMNLYRNATAAQFCVQRFIIWISISKGVTGRSSVKKNKPY